MSENLKKNRKFERFITGGGVYGPSEQIGCLDHGGINRELVEIDPSHVIVLGSIHFNKITKEEEFITANQANQEE